MTAEELRDALGWLDNYGWHGGPSIQYENRLQRHEVVEHAVRTIALPILEADEELVERIAEILQRSGCFEPSQAAHAILRCLIPEVGK